jgi:hypothetical protein
VTDPPSQSKHERREQRRRAARQRLLWKRARLAGIGAAVLAVPLLYAFEHAGSQELVDAEVIETRLRRHYGSGAPHSHTSATLQIEGLSEASLDRADGYERGQRVPVWIRRGRLSGWPYFLDVAKPAEIEDEPVPQQAADGS